MKKPLTPFRSADYSALEVRAAALQMAPANGTSTGRGDLHTDRACKVFSTPHAEVTQRQRDYAKLLTYADWYGR